MICTPNPVGIAALALAVSLTACSQAPDTAAAEPGSPATRASDRASTTTGSVPQAQPFIESDPAVASTRGTASRVLARRDTVEDGGSACLVGFVYAGDTPESLVWPEPCADVTATMITRADLERLNDWDGLDSFERDFVSAMPGGLVLYVAGRFSASIYPKGSNGLSYEVVVSD